VVLFLALGLGLLPGFVRAVLLPPELLGSSKQTSGLTMSLAKPLLGLFILVLALAEPQRHLRLIGALRAWRLWLLPALVVLMCAWVMGVAIDVKWPWWTPLFILSNCFLTVIPEEAFFRGLLQQPLMGLVAGKPGLGWIALLLMGIVFAAVHFGAPMDQAVQLFAVMFVAGVAYAWSFARSRSIEVVVFTHLTVNSLHFLLLSYPLALA
jgi:uncharacterized protein